MDESPERIKTVFTAYENWLVHQPLATNSRRTYRTQVKQFCAFLEDYAAAESDPLHDATARDYAVREYKIYLKTARHLKPTTVNLALAAIDHFYHFLQLGPAKVQRETLPQQAPRALTVAEQKRFLRAIERCPSARDRAVARLLFYTGLRIGECAALNINDVLVSARKGKVIVRSGKGDNYREIPLNSEVRPAYQEWRVERQRRFPESQEQALFLDRQGTRLTPRAIDRLLRKLGEEAGLTLSAHVLRHTCLTNLVRQGHDLVLVAEIAGHRRLETTRRYSLPSESDRTAAMEDLRLDY